MYIRVTTKPVNYFIIYKQYKVVDLLLIILLKLFVCGYLTHEDIKEINDPINLDASQ